VDIKNDLNLLIRLVNINRMRLMKVQISDDLFWGFHRYIDIELFESFEELINYVHNELIIFLHENYLLQLESKAREMKLHNHSYNSYNDLYNLNIEDTIYICGHC
jgi:hypothetical protein